MEHTSLARSEHGAVHGPGLVGPAGMNFSLAGLVLGREIAKTSYGRGRNHAILARLGRLDGEGFAHDRAALTKELKLGKRPATLR
jgi:hypothetical protein